MFSFIYPKTYIIISKCRCPWSGAQKVVIASAVVILVITTKIIIVVVFVVAVEVVVIVVVSANIVIRVACYAKSSHNSSNITTNGNILRRFSHLRLLFLYFGEYATR